MSLRINKEKTIWLESRLLVEVDDYDTVTDIIYKSKGLFKKWEKLNNKTELSKIVDAIHILDSTSGKSGRRMTKMTKPIDVDTYLEEAYGVLLRLRLEVKNNFKFLSQR